MNTAGILISYISQSPIVIFSLSTCPFCVKVRDLLEHKGLEFKEFKVDGMGTEGKTVRDALRQEYNHRTLPALFLKGKFVGGCDATMALNAEGKLQV